MIKKSDLVRGSRWKISKRAAARFDVPRNRVWVIVQNDDFRDLGSRLAVILMRAGKLNIQPFQTKDFMESRGMAPEKTVKKVEAALKIAFLGIRQEREAS